MLTQYVPLLNGNAHSRVGFKPCQEMGKENPKAATKTLSAGGGAL